MLNYDSVPGLVWFMLMGHLEKRFNKQGTPPKPPPPTSSLKANALPPPETRTHLRLSQNVLQEVVWPWWELSGYINNLYDGLDSFPRPCPPVYFFPVGPSPRSLVSCLQRPESSGSCLTFSLTVALQTFTSSGPSVPEPMFVLLSQNLCSVTTSGDKWICKLANVLVLPDLHLV